MYQEAQFTRHKAMRGWKFVFKHRNNLIDLKPG